MKLNFVFILWLVFICFPAGPVSGELSGEMPGEKTPLVISGLPNYAPVLWEENGILVGIGADLARRIFDELGVAIRFEALPFRRALKYAETGKVDVLAGIYKTEDRESYIAYSEPFMDDEGVLFVRMGNEFDYENHSDLIGKKGIINKGYSWGNEFDHYIVRHLDTVALETPDQAFALLINDDRGMDYYLYGHIPGLMVIRRMGLEGKVVSLPRYVTKESFYFGFSKKSKYYELIPKVNAIMRKLVADHLVDELTDKYINTYQKLEKKQH